MLKFTITGNPIGKGRPRFARQGSFVRVFTPEKTVSYENHIKQCAKTAMSAGDLSVIEGAISLNLVINIEPPKSWSKKTRKDALDGIVYPTTKPDIDNIVKVVADGCNGVVWHDDKQVTKVTAVKQYREVAGVDVTVSPLCMGI